MQLTFPSYGFVFLFLPAALIIRRLLAIAGRKFFRHTGREADRLFLTVLSLLFYLSFGLRNFAILLGQALFVYLFIQLLLRLPKQRCRLFAGIFIACTLASLAFFKYLSPFMPVAISFTTFSLVSLLADTARGEITELSLPDHLLYVFFFPKLLQGPIERYEDFRVSAAEAWETPVSAQRFAQAMFYFILGLSKKILLADSLVRPADFAYADPAGLLWGEAVLSVIAYSLHMYFDFSGYCDMGRAVAWMFGFDLTRNFDHPYRAVNINDHWRRWHSTLSRFFVRYVYIPLGGSRRGKARAFFNTLFVFFLSGLWHGNGICFVLWGCCHGLLACVTRLLDKPLPVPRFIKVAGTFSFVTLAFILFRSPTFDVALTMYSKIFDKPWFVLHDRFIDTWLKNELWYPMKVLGVPNVRLGGLICMWLLLGISFLFVFAAPDALELSERFYKRLQPREQDGPKPGSGKRGSARIAIATAALCAVLFIWCVLSFGEVGSFVYFNF